MKEISDIVTSPDRVTWTPVIGESVISRLDWTGLDWTGLDWTGLTFCTNCIHDTKHATITSIQVSVYIVFFCYFKEALQPCIPTVILKSHVTVTIAKQGRGGRGCRLECTPCQHGCSCCVHYTVPEVKVQKGPHIEHMHWRYHTPSRDQVILNFDHWHWKVYKE